MDVLKSSIIGLGTSIVNGIKDLLILLFVPSNNLFDDVKVLFDEKFGIFNQIIELAGSLTLVNDDDVPTFNITLYGKKLSIIDFSIFGMYRSFIHNIIIFIAYFNFIIWLLKSAPSIISGKGGTLSQRGD